MATLLEVRDLRTYFFTQAGVVKAVDGISYALEEGETLGLVGESGCGKSVSALSIMRLVPDPPGKTVGGEVIFAGRDLLKLPDSEIRRVRGKQIAMVYQEPMTSLNPVLSIERQLTESLELHLRMTKAEARREAVRRLEQVRIPDTLFLTMALPLGVIPGGLVLRAGWRIRCRPPAMRHCIRTRRC